METTAIGSAGTAGTGATDTSLSTLNAEEFLNLLVTELTHQDPFEPVKNQQLLEQIGSIRNMEMTTKLNDTLQSLSLQSSLGSAAALMGKTVSGLTVDDEVVTGVVAGVRVSGGEVLLELEDGRRVGIEDIVHVTEGAAEVAAVEDTVQGTEGVAEDAPVD